MCRDNALAESFFATELVSQRTRRLHSSLGYHRSLTSTCNLSANRNKHTLREA
ncbi:hypothetical protein [Streptomyces sp. NPDC059874]|uniref:hypothetical protein n=1 Tax=Streptomyces sp. NPDC059874 TaxID=3346983 RepID=UPI00365FAA2F